MNTPKIIGVVAFGGLLLIGSLVFNNKPEQQEVLPEEVQTATLPVTFPAGIPLYPDATLASVQETAGDTSTDYSVRLETDASIKDINEWYRTAMSSNEWSIKSDKNIGGYQIIQAENGNLYTSIQAANGSAPETRVISQQVKVRK